MEDIVTDEVIIRSIIKEGKCPFCKKTHVVKMTGSNGTGIGGPDMKLPKIQRYNFICKDKDCGKHFDVPVRLYDNLR